MEQENLTEFSAAVLPGVPASPKKDAFTVDIIPLDDTPGEVIPSPNTDDGSITTVEFVDKQAEGRRAIKIRVVDPETDPAEETFHMSLLDCIMPRILVPVTCTYQLDEDTDKEIVIATISEGLRRLLSDYRFLTGLLYEPEEPNGRPVVRRTSSHTHFTIDIQDLTITDPSFPSYTKLAAAHFPPSILDDRVLPQPFVPSPPVPSPGEGAPILRVQLNLIHGGLILAVAAHHHLIDARGLDKLLCRWSAHSRSILDPESFPPPAPIRRGDLDPSQIDLAAADRVTKPPIVDYREQVVPSLKYDPDPLPTSTIPVSAMAQHIWHIRASKLAALKASAAPLQGSQQWVSTNDCITALMWRAIVRARLAARGIAADDRPISLENSLDVHCAFAEKGSPLADTYVHNVVLFSKATMALRELVAAHNFRAVAVCVREAVEEYRSWATVSRAMRWIAACPRGAGVEMDFAAIGGLDVVVTSWRVLKGYGERGVEEGGGADFGFGALRALRWATPIFDGYCFLYPTRHTSGDAGQDEGVEIYLGLEKGCMEQLLLDKELAQWAEVRA